MDVRRKLSEYQGDKETESDKPTDSEEDKHMPAEGELHHQKADTHQDKPWLKGIKLTGPGGEDDPDKKEKGKTLNAIDSAEKPMDEAQQNIEQKERIESSCFPRTIRI